MGPIPAAAQGAIFAAIITSAIAFAGLLITKEQKTSELRQQWIDALRNDLADYVANLWTIRNAVKHATKRSMWEVLNETLTEQAKVSARINLRLNPKESESKALLAAMKSMSDIVQRSPMASYNEVLTTSEKIQEVSGILLKKEWERVKDGEPFYQIARAIFLVVLVAGGIFLAVRGDWGG